MSEKNFVTFEEAKEAYKNGHVIESYMGGDLEDRYADYDPHSKHAATTNVIEMDEIFNAKWVIIKSEEPTLSPNEIKVLNKINDLRSKIQEVEDDKDSAKSEISKRTLEKSLEYLYNELEELEQQFEALEG